MTTPIAYGKLNYRYDEKSDVLYAFIDKPRPAKCIDEQEGIIIRYDINTKEIVGFTIIDYMHRRKDGVLQSVPHFKDISLPIYPSLTS